VCLCSAPHSAADLKEVNLSMSNPVMHFVGLQSVGAAARRHTPNFLICAAAAVLVAAYFSPQISGKHFDVDVLDEPSSTELLEQQLLNIGGSSPDREVILHLSAARVGLANGHYSQASAHCEAAKNISMLIGGELHVESLLASGRTALRRGRFREARRDLEEASLLVDVGGDQAVAVPHTLGTLYRELGDLDQALELLWRAWENGILRDRSDADRMPMVAADIGETHARKGEFDPAIGYIQQAVEQQENLGELLQDSLVAADPELASMYSLLASARHARGEVSQGIGLYRKALQMQRKMLRPSHPDLVATQIGLARAWRDSGSPDLAMQIIEEVEAALRTGPHEGMEFSRALIMKADLLREKKLHAEARLVIEEASELQLQALGGEDSYEVAVALNTHGSILHDAGELDDAHDKYNKALDMNLRTVGIRHPETAATHNSLGTLYEDVGEDSSASAQYRRCLEIQLHTVGPSSPEVANTYNNLATVLFRQGSTGDAAQYLREAVRVLDAAGVPAGNPDRELYASNLAEVLKRIGQAAPSEVSFNPLGVQVTPPTKTDSFSGPGAL